MGASKLGTGIRAILEGLENCCRANGDSAVAQQAEINATNAKAFGEHLKGITNQYQISYIELDQDLELDKVCDIFTQINSRGESLMCLIW